MTTQSNTIHLTSPLTHGPRVRRLQTLMHQHGYFNGAIDGVAGPNTCFSFQIAKYKLGYAKDDIKPTGGQTLIDYLAKPASRPKDYKRRAEARQHTSYLEFQEPVIRHKIVTIARWGIANENLIHYSQGRPIDGNTHPYKLPLYIDCSGFVTLCYHWAGADDPNGRGYDGEGYTGTLMQHMKHITHEMVKPGDVVVWGSYPGHHTAIVLSESANPWLASHGREAGPVEVDFVTECRYQPKYVTWLRLPAWA